MLRMLRDGAKSPVTKFFLFGLMTLAVAGLVFMDVQGVFRGGVAPTDVAEIGETKISIQEFDSIVGRTTQQQRMSKNEAYKLGIVNQILNQQIQIRLLGREAFQQGLYVGDEVVARELGSILKEISSSMNITEDRALMLLLQQQQMSEAQYVGTMKSQLASSLLLDGVLAGPIPSQQLVDDFARFRFEKRSGRYAVIDEKSAGQPEDPSEEDLQTLYKQIAPARFALPEYRRMDVVILSPDAVKDAVELTEEDLKSEYQNRQDEYKVPAQWSYAQTLVSDAATAQEIADKAREGTTLKDATKQVLGDTIAYIPAELFTEGEISEDLRKTVMGLKINGVSDPVESPLGWHIIKLDKKIEPYERSFADVRDDLHEELMMDLAGDSLYDLTIQFDDMIAGGMSAREAAEELGIKLISTEPLDIAGMKQDGKKSDIEEEELPALLKEAFLLGEGETTQLLQSGQSDYIAASVTEIIPASLRPYDEVKDDVRAAWMDRETRIRASKLAGKLIKKINEGADFSAVVKEAGLKVHTVKDLGRQPDLESKLPEGLNSALFNIGKIGEVENLVTGTTAVLVQLDNISLDVPEDSTNELKAIESVTSRLLKQDRLSLYRMALYNEYDVKTNEDAIEKLYGQED